MDLGIHNKAQTDSATAAHPTLEAFLRAPIETVRKVAPKTVFLAFSGTRRRAVLEGISDISAEYPQWTRKQMMNLLALVSSHGIQHIFLTVLIETNFQETTPGYREKLTTWVEWGF
ncbi:MAG: hypothetical protein AAF629_25640, partial [Chloroflexota bacterium]